MIVGSFTEGIKSHVWDSITQHFINVLIFKMNAKLHSHQIAYLSKMWKLYEFFSFQTQIKSVCALNLWKSKCSFPTLESYFLLVEEMLTAHSLGPSLLLLPLLFHCFYCFHSEQLANNKWELNLSWLTPLRTFQQLVLSTIVFFWFMPMTFRCSLICQLQQKKKNRHWPLQELISKWAKSKCGQCAVIYKFYTSREKMANERGLLIVPCVNYKHRYCKSCIISTQARSKLGSTAIARLRTNR